MTQAAEADVALGADARFPAAIRVVDSHTEGEPTHVVVNG